MPPISWIPAWPPSIAVDGTIIAERPIIEFLSGNNVTLGAADDPVNEVVKVTITASGGGSGGTNDLIFPARGSTGFDDFILGARA